ncbi:hypothetical protein VTN02DRAFT_1917 [Thermoascus thermophilus]
MLQGQATAMKAKIIEPATWKSDSIGVGAVNAKVFSRLASQMACASRPPMSEQPQLVSGSQPHDRAEYYSSFSTRPGLAQKFKNIDEEVHFRDYLQHLQDAMTQNFVLDFGNDDAWCAVNLEKEDFVALLDTPLIGSRNPSSSGLDGLISGHPRNRKIRYELVPSVGILLASMMCTEPVKQTWSQVRARDSTADDPDRSVAPQGKDLEDGYPLDDLPDPEVVKEAARFKDLTFAQIVDQIWHFCSVDYGPKYTCIGYNSLYTISGMEIENGEGLPDGKRIWTWIILCSDGTVMSIQENPFPGPHIPREKERKEVLAAIRRNVGLIFSGVSKQHSAASESDSLVTIRVRSVSGTRPDEATIKQEDGPSLLLYYIFDDWVSSYSLVARREHTYGAYLNDLRRKMLVRPEVELVNQLHWVGSRLAVLQRLYQSYELIMMRILQRQRLLRDEARSNRESHPYGNSFSDLGFQDVRQSTVRSGLGILSSYDAPVGVPLSYAAVGRFERLVDRIKLYCLSEIETCLREKESLTFLNFNLIALKDSQAVEKLTRITVLLAKVTILFLPVSLMTAYFSTQIEDLQGVYTARTYWISFGVIMFLSIVVLVIFGYASDTVEGKTIYQSLWRAFVRSSRDRVDRMAQRRRRELK